jgi:uracil-DNA glycosylase family 4
MADSLQKLERDVLRCRRCPRLVEWREEVGRVKRRAFRDEAYWSRPVPSFGDERARLLVLGLAPGAHGANRTGRPFTGDGAGPFLYRGLHRAGLSSGPESTHRGDGLELKGVRIVNAVRCVPPGNKPERAEVEQCFEFLERELALLARTRAILCLGALAWRTALELLRQLGHEVPRPAPVFAHEAELDLGDGAPRLVASFHPSQQNTNTGRLTEPMFARALRRARAAAGL